jgi:hypothetical protein
MHGKRWFWVTVFVVFLVTFAIAIVIWTLMGPYPRTVEGDLEKAGQYGDSYGYVNSLLSALAMGGAIVAILFCSR